MRKPKPDAQQAARAVMAPWEPLPDEEPKWFERFDRYYRPLPVEKRSVLNAYNEWRRINGKPPSRRIPTLWAKAAKRWNWKPRAAAWDEQLRADRLQAERAQNLAMFQRHAALGQNMQALGQAKLADVYARLQEGSLDAISVAEARLLIKDGIEVERAASGIPEGALKAQELSDSDLFARYRTLLASIAGASSHRAGDEAPGAEGPPGPPGLDEEDEAVR